MNPHLVATIIAALVAYLVYRDAEARGMKKELWALGVFCIMLVFLPLYLIKRKPKLEFEEIEYEEIIEEQ
jgi:hypothetical protein